MSPHLCSSSKRVSTNLVLAQVPRTIAIVAAMVGGFSAASEESVDLRLSIEALEEGAVRLSWDKSESIDRLSVAISDDFSSWIQVDDPEVMLEERRAHWVDSSGPLVLSGSRYYRLVPWSPRTIGFAHPESDFAAVLLPRSATGPGFVLVRNLDTGTARRVFVRLEAGEGVVLEEDAQGRLARLEAAGHRFVFSDFTASAATLTHTDPNGVESSEVVALGATGTQKLASAATRIQSDDRSVDELVQDAGEWLVDMSKTHLMAHIYRLGGEAVAERVGRVMEAAQELAEGGRKVALAIGNRISNSEEDPLESADTLLDKAPGFLRELAAIDPAGETTAGFEVRGSSIAPVRPEWDQLFYEQKIDLEFSMVDVSCEESIFADMNPDCPQFVPPQREGALAAHDMILETTRGMAVSQELPSSGSQSYEITRQPSHGTLTVRDPYRGSFTYQPESTFVGEDSFAFVAINATGRSSEGVVNIDVLAGPDTGAECADWWRPRIVGTWEVVDHPFMDPDAIDWRVNWEIEFTELFGSQVVMRETYDLHRYDGTVQPNLEAIRSYYFIFDDINYDGIETCALSYNQQSANSLNQLLLSVSGSDLTLRYNSQYEMTLVRKGGAAD